MIKWYGEGGAKPNAMGFTESVSGVRGDGRCDSNFRKGLVWGAQSLTLRQNGENDAMTHSTSSRALLGLCKARRTTPSCASAFC